MLGYVQENLRKPSRAHVPTPERHCWSHRQCAQAFDGNLA